MDTPKPHRPDIRKLRLPADEKEELRRKLMKMNVRHLHWWLGIIIICLSPLIGTAIYIWLVVTGRLLAQWRIDWYENLGKIFMVVLASAACSSAFPWPARLPAEIWEHSCQQRVGASTAVSISQKAATCVNRAIERLAGRTVNG